MVRLLRSIRVEAEGGRVVQPSFVLWRIQRLMRQLKSCSEVGAFELDSRLNLDARPVDCVREMAVGLVDGLVELGGERTHFVSVLHHHPVIS